MGRSASARTIRSHERLKKAIDACMALAEDAAACDTSASAVSAWSVADHLEHLLRADRWIIGWIETAVGGEVIVSPDEAPAGADTGTPSPVGRVVLSTGFIPRGRGRAPERSQPSGLSASEIRDGFHLVRARVESLETRLGDVDAVKRTLRHPILGWFTPARWLRFAAIHHAHHDKIIRDILDAGAG